MDEGAGNQIMRTKDTKLMLKDILNMCVTRSSRKIGWMAGEQKGFTRIFSNDEDTMQDKDYFFPSMKVANIRVCTDYTLEYGTYVEFISTI